MQLPRPLVCMEARKRARLIQKELERIAGQLMNVDMDIIRHEYWKSIKSMERKSLWCYLIEELSLGCRYSLTGVPARESACYRLSISLC